MSTGSTVVLRCYRCDAAAGDVSRVACDGPTLCFGLPDGWRWYASMHPGEGGTVVLRFCCQTCEPWRGDLQWPRARGDGGPAPTVTP